MTATTTIENSCLCACVCGLKMSGPNGNVVYWSQHDSHKCAVPHASALRSAPQYSVRTVWVCAVASLVGNLILMIEDFANATVRLLDLVGRLVVPNDAIS